MSAVWKALDAKAKIAQSHFFGKERSYLDYTPQQIVIFIVTLLRKPR